jgi:hypothetical protein
MKEAHHEIRKIKEMGNVVVIQLIELALAVWGTINFLFPKIKSC